MNRFARLLDRLAFEPRRSGKLALMEDYFRQTADPDRGWALAALTGSLVLPHAKPGLVRALVAERVDPVLFALSYDHVGDLSETVALMWPAPAGDAPGPAPSLTAVVEALTHTHKAALPGVIAGFLDILDATGRWALLKLVTGAMRVGASARLAKTAVARLGGRAPDEVEEVWHAAEAPYAALFGWIEGRGPPPAAADAAAFRPPMLAQPLDEAELAALDPADFAAEWKWDGIRVQVVAGRAADGSRSARLFSRTGEDITAAFPDLDPPPGFDGAVDGELLIIRDGRVEPFATLQQRLNRKTVTAAQLASHPAAVRAYDLLVEAGEDLRALPFETRRRRLEGFVARLGDPRFDLSPLVAFASWEDLARARADPAAAGADAAAVEGLMLKRRDAPYLPGRPKGPWFKWKRDPMTVDAVLMYAQRGHGKRSSYYSDYTFGVWRGDPPELVPVGKAYFGFTDEELVAIDRFVRNNTIDRFGPVRQVAAGPEHGLVLEVAFEGLARSTRHKSGIAMRFPRIARLRWDKPPREADRLETLEKLLEVRRIAVA